MHHITVLSGGVGGATFLRGLLHGVRRGDAARRRPRRRGHRRSPTPPTTSGCTGSRCAPISTPSCTPSATGSTPSAGWGRRDETWNAKDELAAYGVEPTWFGLGDRDLATHLVRTQMLDAGYPLSEVTEALCRRWQPGVRLLPMTDDRVETHIAIADPDSPSGRRVVHFQEYWVRLHAEVPAEAVIVVGLEDVLARPRRDRRDHRRRPRRSCPRATRWSASARSSACRGVREALVATRAPVVGLSPIVGGTHVRGMAHQLLTAIGVEVGAGGGRAALRRPIRRRGARRLARRHRRRGRASTRVREAGLRVRGRAAADDLARGDRGDGGRRRVPGLVSLP